MINRFKLSHFYLNSIQLPRHWCPLSQPYAGVDALLSYLDEGWQIRGEIGCDEHWFGESRRILVYRFILNRQDSCVTMHVLWNPVLERLLSQFDQGRTSPVKRMSRSATDSHEPASMPAIVQSC
jgi:hypothetical protein